MICDQSGGLADIISRGRVAEHLTWIVSVVLISVHVVQCSVYRCV